MKAVILAGGLGSRLGEEAQVKPKPLVEIGGRPIIWHIMKLYSFHGVSEFIICLGYKGYMIKEYFLNYHLHTSDVTIDLHSQDVTFHGYDVEPWRITLVDTGNCSGTGGRLKKVMPHLKSEEFFFFTYGDGVGDVDINRTLNFHRNHGRLATISVMSPPVQFGVLDLNDEKVLAFKEKPDQGDAWVNGGFFILSPEVGKLIDNDETYWEQAPMKRLIEMDQIRAYHHTGFWCPMDTQRDKETLENYWQSGAARWKIW